MTVVASQWSRAHRNHTAGWWLDLIRQFFTEQRYVAVEGLPSLKLSTEYAEQEAVRTQQQIERLGPAGLQAKQEELEAAISSQTLPSDEILNQIPLGDVNKGSCSNIETLMFGNYQAFVYVSRFRSSSGPCAATTGPTTRPASSTSHPYP